MPLMHGLPAGNAPRNRRPLLQSKLAQKLKIQSDVLTLEYVNKNVNYNLQVLKIIKKGYEAENGKLIVGLFGCD